MDAPPLAATAPRITSKQNGGRKQDRQHLAVEYESGDQHWEYGATYKQKMRLRLKQFARPGHGHFRQAWFIARMHARVSRCISCAATCRASASSGLRAI